MWYVIFKVFEWLNPYLPSSSGFEYGSRPNIVKAARSHKNCIKISVSKYSHVICLFIGFSGRRTHFQIEGRQMPNAASKTVSRYFFCKLTHVICYFRFLVLPCDMSEAARVQMRTQKRPQDDFLDINTCDMLFPFFSAVKTTLLYSYFFFLFF